MQDTSRTLLKSAKVLKDAGTVSDRINSLTLARGFDQSAPR